MDLIIHNKVTPAVNQIETHPFNQQIETQKFLQENNVQIESWGPFAEGKNNMFQNELLLSFAGKYKKSVAQIILRWLISKRSSRYSKISSQGKNYRKFQHFRF